MTTIMDYLYNVIYITLLKLNKSWKAFFCILIKPKPELQTNPEACVWLKKQTKTYNTLQEIKVLS